MDDNDRRLLQQSLAQVVTDAPAAGLRHALSEFGWYDLLAEHPAVAVAGLATLQGEHLTSSTLVDEVMLAAAGISDAQGVVHPDLPHSAPTSRLEGTTLHVSGVTTEHGRQRYAVPALTGQHGTVIVITSLPEQPEVVGLDPDAGWRRIHARVEVDASDVLTGSDTAGRWPIMLPAGHRALAHELTAIGRRMLEIAVEHVATREQFGRQLGRFQAVQHALADVRLWLECADLAAAAAWEDELPQSAQLAKILAGRLVLTAAANCQQVLGGMGFTWEHKFHRYLRRGLLLEPLLGSAAVLRAELGAHVKKTARIPQLAQL